MNKVATSLVVTGFVFGISFTSCKKNDCAECHYDTPSGEVEMGEKCGDELENLEAVGKTTVNGVEYVVHCGEDH